MQAMCQKLAVIGIGRASQAPRQRPFPGGLVETRVGSLTADSSGSQTAIVAYAAFFIATGHSS